MIESIESLPESSSTVNLSFENQKRFWSFVDWRNKSSDECWPWIGAHLTAGYGHWANGRKEQYTSHRVAYMLSKGPIPKKHYCCHRCDYPPCCNPNHLFAWRPKKNTADMLKKGRHKAHKGEQCHNAKLTDDDVREIRRRIARGEKQYLVARHFNVPYQTIQGIRKGTRWGHVSTW
jgi:hypothetical protein